MGFPVVEVKLCREENYEGGHLAWLHMVHTLPRRVSRQLAIVYSCAKYTCWSIDIYR